MLIFLFSLEIVFPVSFCLHSAYATSFQWMVRGLLLPSAFLMLSAGKQALSCPKLAKALGSLYGVQVYPSVRTSQLSVLMPSPRVSLRFPVRTPPLSRFFPVLQSRHSFIPCSPMHPPTPMQAVAGRSGRLDRQLSLPHHFSALRSPLCGHSPPHGHVCVHL